MKSNIIFISIIGLNLILFAIFIFTKYFSPFFMLLHVGSLLFLWGYILKKMGIIRIIKSHSKEVILIIGLLLLAFLVRIDRIEEITPGMYPDEVTIAVWGLNFLKQAETPPFIGGYSHPTPLIYITGASVKTFGHTMSAIRLPNVIFGAISVGLFYILLRLFFPTYIAFFGAIMMVFQYSHVILSRLAYEPIPSLVWQISTLIFFVLFLRKKTLIYLVALALSLGGGLYTYLNFRPFAILLFILTIFFLIRFNWRQQLRSIGMFIAFSLVAIMPLISYIIIDPQGFSSRVNEISIFSRNYSSSEFTKELWGNIYRTAVFPFIQLPATAPDSLPSSGDPNPGKNPASAPMFDVITVILALVGLVFLFKKNRLFFWIMLLLLIPPFISDIFSTEVIPEFHYYGLGHPNALRSSGFILVILFTACSGVYWIYSRWGKEKIMETVTLISLVLVIISCWNWHLYFNQKQINPNFYVYNYTFNFARANETANYLNKTNAEKISVSKDITEKLNFQFFINPTKKVTSFELTNNEQLLDIITKSDLTAIGLTKESIPLVNKFDTNSIINLGYTISTLNNPFEQPSVIIIRKTNVPELNYFFN